MSKNLLYYVYDPMCSWCWGYRDTWLELQEKLEKVVAIKPVLGGLAEDSDEAMPEQMQLFLQQTWQKISQQLGAQFNFDFWTQCQPKRSTYPACRAIVFARQYQKEQAMCLAIQQAYYLQAQNPSDVATLTDIAAAIGLDRNLFSEQLNSERLKQQLRSEIAMARALPIQGFPSLVLAVDEDLYPIKLDYKNCQTSYDAIVAILTKNES